MQEINMEMLAEEVRESMAQKLEAGDWYWAVFYKGELIWSNDERRVWCGLLKNYKFQTKHSWEREAMSFVISLKSEQDCWIDEIQISVVKDPEVIYSRIVTLGPIYLKKQDIFTTLLKFYIHTEVS